MAFIRGRSNTTALSSATSANGTARNGAALSLNNIQPGMLLIDCTSNITTSSVVATFKVQVSDDNSTWSDLKLLNQPAEVTTAAGTGSPVATLRSICVDAAAWCKPYLRVVATLSGAATAGADVTSASYRWLRYGVL